VVRRRHDRPGPPLCRGRRKKGDPDEPADHALGRSRGGFSTKIHVVCDSQGAPLNVVLSPGQTHETQLFETLWDTTEIPDEQLEHFVRPDALGGDKGYYSHAILGRLRSDEVRPVIPEIGKTIAEQDQADFDRGIYRGRNGVERLVGWLKESRRVFGRFEKTAVNYLAMIHVACIRYYMAMLA
jgi:transposase